MIQIGILGAGRIGQVHMRGVVSGVTNARIRAIADPFMSEPAEQLAKSFGIPHIGRDYRAVLNDPEIDAVLICSSTDMHAKLSVEAIAAGKHVFCEKPVDHELARISEVEAALKAGAQGSQIPGRLQPPLRPQLPCA